MSETVRSLIGNHHTNRFGSNNPEFYAMMRPIWSKRYRSTLYQACYDFNSFKSWYNVDELRQNMEKILQHCRVGQKRIV